MNRSERSCRKNQNGRCEGLHPLPQNHYKLSGDKKITSFFDHISAFSIFVSEVITQHHWDGKQLYQLPGRKLDRL
jgi:hypothetical protein